MAPDDTAARRAAATVARTGTRAVRDLITQTASPTQVKLPPLAPDPASPAADPWQMTSPPKPASPRAGRAADLTRRGLSLLTLLGISVLGAIVTGLAVLGLGFGVALKGSVLAGVLLVVVLLLALLSGYWTLRRASGLLKAEADVPMPAATPAPTAQTDEDNLLTLLRQHEHRLPALPRQAFHATVIAVRDALRLTTNDTALERDTYDVRQAAREDLPELMDAYQAVPRSTQSDGQLLEQLRLIQERMQRVKVVRVASRERELDAHGRYLKDKYLGELE